MTELLRLSSSAVAVERPDSVGIVHLGLGAFHRSHQAWYTSRADRDGRWGISAFTGRSAAAAKVLDQQDGLYTLIERGETDRMSVIGQLLSAHPGTDLAAWGEKLTDPALSLLTITVTEAGYRLDDAGQPNWLDPLVVTDLERLRTTADHGIDAEPSTIVGRIVAGLAERRRAVDLPLSVVPCDNIPANGTWLETGVLAFAERVDPGLADWIRDRVRFVRTSVDRITPAATGSDQREIEAAFGFTDLSPVVAEQYSSWILSGEFPAGRPDWETAGAEFVNDIEPFERRKLWLLNGAHTALALVAPAYGATTVADAIEIPECLLLVEQIWDAAERHLPEGLDLPAYRGNLLSRFTDRTIRHLLTQIASDSSRKLQVRIAPIATAERAAGRSAEPLARVIAAWVVAARAGAVEDADVDRIREAVLSPDSVRALVGILDARLADDADFVAEVRRHALSSPNNRLVP